MMQFYFLSILLNAASGAALVGGAGAAESLVPSFLRRETPRLVLGILTMLTGLLKLLSPAKGDLLLIGDLLPAAAGLAAGFILVFDFYRGRSSLEDERTERFAGILERNRKYAGFAALASAALHFFFPGVLFL